MSDDDTYEIPLQDQRIFGAGIKRQRVRFVPSTSSSINVPLQITTPAKSVSNLYLKLVLPADLPADKDVQSLSIKDSELSTTPASENTANKVCEICNLPVDSAKDSTVLVNAPPPDASTPKPRHHEASIAHQVCLAHSHPPSHLDRSRKGLAYLSAYGWDPDARVGLGASGQGIKYPIKTKPKDDKLGIGVVLPKDIEKLKKRKLVKLDAGKVRKMQEKDKRKAEKLKDIFYRSEEVERYLGGG